MEKFKRNACNKLSTIFPSIFYLFEKLGPKEPAKPAQQIKKNRKVFNTVSFDEDHLEEKSDLFQNELDKHII